MLKRVGILSILILLLAIAVSYTLRLSITKWFLEPTLKSAGVELTCIDWSITSKLTLKADKVCIDYDGQQLDLRGIELSTTHLDIDEAELHVHTLDRQSKSVEHSLSSNKNAQPLRLNLPTTRPLLSIHSLKVYNDRFTAPFTLTIKEPERNQLSIIGDINANITLSEQLIEGDINLTSNAFMQTALNDLLLKNIPKLKETHFDTRHRIRYDGETLQLLSNIDLQLAYFQTNEDTQQNTSATHCIGTLTNKGQLRTDINLSDTLVRLDASKLTTHFALSNECLTLMPDSQYRDFLVDQLALNWQLQLPTPIEITKQRMAIPDALFESKDQNQFQFKFSTVSLDFNQPLQTAASLQTEIKTKDIQHFQLNAHLKDKQLSGSYAVNEAKAPAFLDIKAKNTTLNGQFHLLDISHKQPTGRIESQITIGEGEINQFAFQGYNGTLDINIDDHSNAMINLTNHLAKASMIGVTVRDLNNTTDVVTTVKQINTSAKNSQKAKQPPIYINARTTLENIRHPTLTVTNIDVETEAEAMNGKIPQVKATHRISLDDIKTVVNHTFTEKKHPFRLTIPPLDAITLNPFIKQFDPAVQLTKGTLSGVIEGDINTQTAKLRMQLKQLSGLYNDYLIDGFSTHFSGQVNSTPSSELVNTDNSPRIAQVTMKQTDFTLDELRSGVIVQKIAGQWQIERNQLRIHDLQGELFDGNFSLDQYVLGAPKQIAHVRFSDIDASKLIALYDESGILLTGRYGGTLPIVFEGDKVEILEGMLANQNQGKLIINNNAAFNAIKNQQKELQDVLILLEDLDITTLHSNVRLQPNGELALSMNLKGYNKKQSQEVNFNYNHEENVFTLLRALRLSDEITQLVEQEFLK
ncbi:YdbH domain-containing protein [Marinomonas sp. 2405UD68-3]|uniref:YdbH domain-containing protein n=1 Tax=Marinomonas sp. 2405UD68-3 TaxID=3391835 RepID=UPI0039C9199D